MAVAVAVGVAVAVAVAGGGGGWCVCVCVCVCVFDHGLYWGFWAWVSLSVAFVSCFFAVGVVKIWCSWFVVLVCSRLCVCVGVQSCACVSIAPLLIQYRVVHGRS